MVGVVFGQDAQESVGAGQAENFPEFGSIEAVDDEVGGGVENHEISDKDVHNPSARRNVISTIFKEYQFCALTADPATNSQNFTFFMVILMIYNLPTTILPTGDYFRKGSDLI